MKLIQLEVGNLGTNCYIIYCEESRKGFVIDPGGDPNRIMAAVNDAKISVEAIINTHGHIDHVMSNNIIKETTKAPIWIHSEDAGMLTSASRNLSTFMGAALNCGPADRELKEGELLSAGSVTLRVVHTPGHTPGGISLLVDKAVIVGDTLFAESIGRSDFPGGSHSQLIDSIKTKLMVLDDDVKVYPGHGPATTIGRERRRNPFIQ